VSRTQPTRRRTLRRLGTVAAVGGVAALAGCQSGQDPDEGRPRVPNEPNYRDWFDGVGNYSGTIDARGEEAVTVTVGAQGNNGYFAFGPAAIAVSTGTTVTWEWTGRGGDHNVVSEQGAFDSGDAIDSDEETFSTTLENPAVYRYVCEPHRSVGMRGAVFVALGQPG
jgi:halocyanin-like protein